MNLGLANSNSVRTLFREWALNALAWKSLFQGNLGNFEPTPVVQLILIHRIAPEEEKPFASFLQWLVAHYEVVSYSAAIESIQSGSGNRPKVAISFDDGRKDNLAAAKILNDHGMSGCFFICPDVIGETDRSKVEKYCRERMLWSAPKEFISWSDLVQLKDLGHEIGNHSNGHYVMADLDTDKFVDEVNSGREKLAHKLGPVKHFAWPYGRFFHFKKKWVGKVAELGHKSCASAERGAHLPNFNLPNPTSFCLRRDRLDMSWKPAHWKYFLSKSTRNPITLEQAWPEK